MKFDMQPTEKFSAGFRISIIHMRQRSVLKFRVGILVTFAVNLQNHHQPLPNHIPKRPLKVEGFEQKKTDLNRTLFRKRERFNITNVSF